MTLTEEQFEDLLGAPTVPEGLAESDRQRLGEARAIRERLRGALAGVRASEGLAGRIRAGLEEKPQAQRKPGRFARLAIRLMPAAMAAAILLLVAPTVIYLGQPASVMAATEELTRIHEGNLAGAGGFVKEGDRERIEAHFRERLDFVAVAIPAGQGVRLEGGCVASIRSRPAASYLVDVEGRKITVIVTRQSPEELGLVCGCGKAHCKCYHKGACKGCNLVSKEIGAYAYTAVGKATQDELRDVLARIVR